MTDHVLAVHVIDHRSDPPDVTWEIEGGHNGECAVWYRCEQCKDETPAWDREDGYDEVVFHGVWHRYIEGDWMTESGQCAAYESDAVHMLSEIGRNRGIGRWPVHISYWGDGIWEAEDLTDEEKT